MKSFVRYRQVKEILEDYNYPLPLQEYLQEYFKKNKNAGSRDRKELRQLAYSWMRLGRTLRELEFEKRLQLADYLFNARAVLENPFPVHIDFGDKLAALKSIYPDFTINSIFPFPEKISGELNKEGLIPSYARQPFVWIKVSETKETLLERELTAASIPFEKYDKTIWKFQPEVKLTDLEGFQKGYFRVQDMATQQTSEYFHARAGENWLDCCAGAGGKSLALLDKQPWVSLYATDVRDSILKNYKSRLDVYRRNHAAKIMEPHISQINLEQRSPYELPMMDGIIADMPCTGSGTWARAPEHLVYFEADKIKEYNNKQLKILKHAWPLLKAGKPLIYITCSVYAEENEKVIQAFAEQNSAIVEEQKYLEGYNIGAENIFLCRMIKTEEGEMPGA